MSDSIGEKVYFDMTFDFDPDKKNKDNPLLHAKTPFYVIFQSRKFGLGKKLTAVFVNGALNCLVPVFSRVADEAGYVVKVGMAGLIETAVRGKRYFYVNVAVTKSDTYEEENVRFSFKLRHDLKEPLAKEIKVATGFVRITLELNANPSDEDKAKAVMMPEGDQYRPAHFPT